jgi:hypothetical protein
MPDMSEVTGRIFASMWKSGRDEFRRTGVLDPTFAIWSRVGKSIARFRVPFWNNALESQCWEVVRAACVFHDAKILLMLLQAWRADPSSSARARDSAMLPIRKPNRRQHRAAERKLDELRALAQWFLIPPSAKIEPPESAP